MEDISSPMQQNSRGRLKGLALSDRSLSIGERDAENGLIEIRSGGQNSSERE